MEREENENQQSLQSSIFSGIRRQHASASPDIDPKLEALLEEVIEELNECFHQGQRPALDDYLHKYPQLAEPLQRSFEVLTLLYTFRDPQPQDRSLPPVNSPSDLNPLDPNSSRPLSEVPLGQLGEFRLLRQIGRGGMGIVYEAEQISLGRRVAIKTLPLAAMLDPKQLQRFQNEARAAAMLDHPHIVGVYSVGTDRGVYFYAMQYIDGRTLSELINELRDQEGIDAFLPVGPSLTQSLKGPLTNRSFTSQRNDRVHLTSSDASTVAAVAMESTLESSKPSSSTGTVDRSYFQTVARLGIQAAQALEHAHQFGIIHRDIKPSNLMVNSQGHLWITDFGLAQIESAAELTMTGDLLGTLRYMSPEQAQGNHRELGHRSDIYSLGATLYEMLSLRPVVLERRRAHILREILEGEPKPLRSWNPSIPRDLETIVHKALGKHPSERYSSAQELADDLKRFLDDQPIRARRPSLADRMGKWTRRHRAGVMTAVALSLVVIITAGGFKLHADQRLRDVAEAIRTSITATRTAIEADDLKLAGRKLAEAEGKLGTAEFKLPELAGTIHELRSQLEKREQDIERFEQLIMLAHKAQEILTHTASLEGEEDADRALSVLVSSYGRNNTRIDQALKRGSQAGSIAAILADEAWLKDSMLSETQKQTLRATVYETLLRLAEFGIRWNKHRSEQRVRDSLSYLELASEFHPPTRAFYWVRSECYRFLENDDAAKADRQSFEKMPASFAWDHYLPSDSFDLQDDVKEALRPYRAALMLQPDDYNTLYLLAEHLSKLGQFEESVLAYRACIALRPLVSNHYFQCAVSLAKLKRFEEAEQLLVNAVNRIKRELGDLHPETGHALRYHGFFSIDFLRNYDTAIADHLEALEITRKTVGENHEEYADRLWFIGIMYRDNHQYAEAEPVFIEAREFYRRHFGEDHMEYAICTADLGVLYFLMNRLEEAEPLVRESLAIHRRAPRDRHFNSLLVLADQLSKQEQFEDSVSVYHACIDLRPLVSHHYYHCAISLAKLQRFEEAEQLLTNAIKRIRQELGNLHPETIHALKHLGSWYSSELENYEAAETVLEEALEIRKALSGKDHPDTKEIMQTLLSLRSTRNGD